MDGYTFGYDQIHCDCFWQPSEAEKTYHIPYLTHAVVKDGQLMAATSFNKIMEIDLSNGSRRFI